jgi:hypothetical protein
MYYLTTSPIGCTTHETAAEGAPFAPFFSVLQRFRALFVQKMQFIPEIEQFIPERR